MYCCLLLGLGQKGFTLLTQLPSDGVSSLPSNAYIRYTPPLQVGKERRKNPPADDTLSPSTLGDGRLPKLDKAGLAFVRDAIDGKGNSFTMAFLEQTIPKASEDAILEEVRARCYVPGIK